MSAGPAPPQHAGPAPPVVSQGNARVDVLWHRARVEADPAAREELICHYLPLARTVAATLYARRYHNEIEFGEYLQYATLGMIEALDRFDLGRGVQFASFASHRMHGAVMDGLARSTEKQQQIALRTRLQQERLASLKKADAQPANDGFFPGNALLSQLAEVGIGLALACLLEDTNLVQGEEDVPDRHHIPYLQAREREQLQDQVRALVDALPPQQRLVVHGHYAQEMPFEQIAKMMGLSKGRISQIHKQALGVMRDRLKAGGGCDVAW